MDIHTAKTIIGVMGPANTTKEILNNAYTLGQLIAREGFIVLTGGTNVGVMDETLKGAKSVGGCTIGILIDNHLNNMSKYVDIPIVTGLGSARNNINVLTSVVVIACGIGTGTTSEVALALKANKNVILLNNSELGNSFFKSLDAKRVWIANDPAHVIFLLKNLLVSNTNDSDHHKLLII